MTDKGLNLFDECVVKCIYFSSQEEGNSKMYTSGTIANSQTTPTEINKKVLLPGQEC